MASSLSSEILGGDGHVGQWSYVHGPSVRSPLTAEQLVAVTGTDLPELVQLATNGIAPEGVCPQAVLDLVGAKTNR